ncbi:hypothetical protein ASY01nite_22220 [Acetobacter syzygii]|uniref:hypothetical protein n=1 Tax=Acetobacter syzygii TaxID=146476 RepID=UPI0005E56E27|nr:hypothetical protein [Acetobacter syzygii]GAN71101.1 hypothetical protein Absy_013_007 [Acetobacter syzygii]GBR64597.1 hypothetical protein AA0483_1433 [Acetobacter syzygii NRIC 0483]GEL57156.1 hypothetical protein ASY01nite_22220 [Acetobacter syzygii]
MRSLSRREIFPTLGATALAGIAAAGLAKPETLAAAPKAKPLLTSEERLIALCEEFIRMEFAVNAVHATCDTFEQEKAVEPKLEALYAQERKIFDQIEAIKATTLKGFIAKARAFAAWDRGNYLSRDSGNWDIAMIGNIMQELIALGPKDNLAELCPTIA